MGVFLIQLLHDALLELDTATKEVAHLPIGERRSELLKRYDQFQGQDDFLLSNSVVPTTILGRYGDKLADLMVPLFRKPATCLFSDSLHAAESGGIDFERRMLRTTRRLQGEVIEVAESSVPGTSETQNVAPAETTTVTPVDSTPVAVKIDSGASIVTADVEAIRTEVNTSALEATTATQIVIVTNSSTVQTAPEPVQSVAVGGTLDNNVTDVSSIFNASPVGNEAGTEVAANSNQTPMSPISANGSNESNEVVMNAESVERENTSTIMPDDSGAKEKLQATVSEVHAVDAAPVNDESSITVIEVDAVDAVPVGNKSPVKASTQAKVTEVTADDAAPIDEKSATTENAQATVTEVTVVDDAPIDNKSPKETKGSDPPEEIQITPLNENGHPEGNDLNGIPHPGSDVLVDDRGELNVIDATPITIQADHKSGDEATVNHMSDATATTKPVDNAIDDLSSGNVDTEAIEPVSNSSSVSTSDNNVPETKQGTPSAEKDSCQKVPFYQKDMIAKIQEGDDFVVEIASDRDTFLVACFRTCTSGNCIKAMDGLDSVKVSAGNIEIEVDGVPVTGSREVDSCHFFEGESNGLLWQTKRDKFRIRFRVKEDGGSLLLYSVIAL